MARCPSCGVQIHDNAQSCDDCGAHFSTAAGTGAERAVSRRRTKHGMAFVCFAFAAMFYSVGSALGVGILLVMGVLMEIIAWAELFDGGRGNE
jgi:hypothetical protein